MYLGPYRTSVWSLVAKIVSGCKVYAVYYLAETLHRRCLIGSKIYRCRMSLDCKYILALRLKKDTDLLMFYYVNFKCNTTSSFVQHSCQANLLELEDRKNYYLFLVQKTKQSCYSGNILFKSLSRKHQQCFNKQILLLLSPIPAYLYMKHLDK